MYWGGHLVFISDSRKIVQNVALKAGIHTWHLKWEQNDYWEKLEIMHLTTEHHIITKVWQNKSHSKVLESLHNFCPKVGADCPSNTWIRISVDVVVNPGAFHLLFFRLLCNRTYYVGVLFFFAYYIVRMYSISDAACVQKLLIMSNAFIIFWWNLKVKILSWCSSHKMWNL